MNHEDMWQVELPWTPKTEQERADMVALCVEMGRRVSGVPSARLLEYAAQIVPRVPVVLREVQFGGYDDWYRWNDGRLEALCGDPARWVVQTHIPLDWLDEVVALKANPVKVASEPVAWEPLTGSTPLYRHPATEAEALEVLVRAGAVEYNETDVYAVALGCVGRGVRVLILPHHESRA